MFLCVSVCAYVYACVCIIYICVYVYVFGFFTQGLAMLFRLALISLYSPNWPWTPGESAALVPLSAGAAGVYHHTQLPCIFGMSISPELTTVDLWSDTGNV